MAHKPIKILHFSPHDEDDGIAKYQEQYLAGMSKNDAVENKFFDVKPIQLRAMNPQQHEEVYDKLRGELADFDIFHVQHEFGLFVEDDFQRLVAWGRFGLFSPISRTGRLWDFSTHFR